MLYNNIREINLDIAMHKKTREKYYITKNTFFYVIQFLAEIVNSIIILN